METKERPKGKMEEYDSQIVFQIYNEKVEKLN